MINFIGGVQLLVVFFYGAALFHNLTGAGTLPSLVFGGMGASAIMGGLFVKFPKLMVFLGSAIWIVLGFWLGHYLSGEIGTSLASMFVIGGCGSVANYVFMQQSHVDFQKGSDWAAARLPAVNSKSDTDAVLAVWHGIKALDRIGAIEPATYREINGKCAEILRMPNPPDGTAPETSDLRNAGIEGAAALKRMDLITEGEHHRMLEKVIDLTAGTARLQRPSQLAPDNPPAKPTPIKWELREEDRPYLAAQLFRLAYNRALNLEVFGRVMNEIDPSYDVSLATAERYPVIEDYNEDDSDTIHNLRKLGLITIPEHHRAMQIIMPRLDPERMEGWA